MALPAGLKSQIHAVLGKEGVTVPMSNLFGVAGQDLLDDCSLAPAYRLRVESLRSLIRQYGHEITIVGTEIVFLRISRPHGSGPTAGKIARVAVGRKIVTLVYYGLRDGKIRCLAPSG